MRGNIGRIPRMLFEHDVYFQSIARALEFMPGALARLKARFEYLRALRYELRLLGRCDQVQVCTRENREYLASFSAENRAAALREGLRAGIDTARYEFRPCGREPLTMLFLGSFRHVPTASAWSGSWMRYCRASWRAGRRPGWWWWVRMRRRGTPMPDRAPAIEIRGFVEDIREPLARYAVFVCPCAPARACASSCWKRSASGIPVVSTRIGAEGLARKDGEFCFLADEPASLRTRCCKFSKARSRRRRWRRARAQKWRQTGT